MLGKQLPDLPPNLHSKVQQVYVSPCNDMVKDVLLEPYIKIQNVTSDRANKGFSIMQLKDNTSPLLVDYFFRGISIMSKFGDFKPLIFLNVKGVFLNHSRTLWNVCTDPIQNSLRGVLTNPKDSWIKKMLSECEPSDDFLRECVTNLAAALESLHKNKYVHGDLTSAAAFFVSCNSKYGVTLKLGGFSEAHKFGQKLTRTPTSYFKPRTFQYFFAPETISKGEYNAATDIFNFGIVLWEILNLKSINHALSLVESADLKYYDEIVFNNQIETVLSLRNINPYVADLIRKCWYPEPSARPTAAQIVHRLEEIEL